MIVSLEGARQAEGEEEAQATRHVLQGRRGRRLDAGLSLISRRLLLQLVVGIVWNISYRTCRYVSA